MALGAILPLLVGTVSAQTITQPSDSVFTFFFKPRNDGFYLNSPRIRDNKDMFNRLFEELRKLRRQGNTPYIWVNGYSSTMKDSLANVKLAGVRSNRVKSEIVIRKQAKEINFITDNHVGTYNDLMDVVLVSFYDPNRVASEPTPEPKTVEEPARPPKPEPKPAPRPAPVVELLPEPESEKRYCSLDLRTNLLYDALLVPSLGVEWHVSPSVGIKFDGSYSHWGGSDGKVQRVWLVSPEVRWYPGQPKRFYVGLGANIGDCNIYGYPLAKLVSKDTGYQGSLLGGSITLGYRLPLGRNWGVDFNIGLGCTHLEYDSFHIEDGKRVYTDKDMTKDIWGPSQAGISLVWKIIK